MKKKFPFACMLKNFKTSDCNALFSLANESVLPTYSLDSFFWEIELTTLEQAVGQTHQFTGGEHRRHLMFRGLFRFSLIEGTVGGIVYSQCVGSFDKVASISRTNHPPSLCFQLTGLMSSPNSASHFVDGVIVFDSVYIADFRDDSCSWEATQGVRKVLEFIIDCAISTLPAGRQAPDVANDIIEDKMFEASQFWSQAIRFLPCLLNLGCGSPGVREAIFAVPDQELSQLVKNFLCRNQSTFCWKTQRILLLRGRRSGARDV